MLAEGGQTADCAWSSGMKLSWDINDPQMPQVRAGRARPGPCPPREGGEEGQVLSGTVGRAPLHIPESPQMERDSTHGSVLPWGVLKAELGLEISSPSVFLALVGKHNKSGGIC